jgi:hypothetical protein
VESNELVTSKSTKGILKKSLQLELGKAGEHLVCADLLLKGNTAFLADQGVPYDIVVDTGSKIVRVQVKSTQYPKNSQKGRRTDTYFYHIRRAGRGANRIYEGSEFDMFALVALDRKLIAYIPIADAPKQYVAMRVPEFDYGEGGKASRHFSMCSFDKALEKIVNG